MQAESFNVDLTSAPVSDANSKGIATSPKSWKYDQ